MVILFGDIRDGRWGGRLALGEAVLSVLGSVCVRGDWFPPVMSLADKFLVFAHCL